MSRFIGPAASAAAIFAMLSFAVSCSPRTEEPAENPNTPSVAPSEKRVPNSSDVSKVLNPGGRDRPIDPSITYPTQDDSCGAIGHLCD